MPKIVFLPHQDLCPDGIVVEAETGETILDAALRSGIEIEHACEKSCACTTCHCIVREGLCKFTQILQLPQNTKGGIARC